MVFKNTYTQPKMEKIISHPPLGPWAIYMESTNFQCPKCPFRGPFTVKLFLYFQGIFKNTYTQPKMEKMISHPPLGPWATYMGSNKFLML